MKLATSILAAAALALVAQGASAQASTNERSMTVKTNDLDLSKQADRAALSKRIDAAASTVCSASEGQNHIPDFLVCKARAKASTKKAVRELTGR